MLTELLCDQLMPYSETIITTKKRKNFNPEELI
jgi:hypothetical protein